MPETGAPVKALQLLRAACKAGYLAVENLIPRKSRQPLRPGYLLMATGRTTARRTGQLAACVLLSRSGPGRLTGVTSVPALPLDRELSAATARGDAPRIVVLLESTDVSALLQSAGHAVLVVAATGAAISSDVARRLAGQLDERGWDGDAELAALLRADPVGAAPGKRALSVELDEVADLLQGDPELSYGGYIDLETGVTWPSSVLDDGGEDVPNPDADPDRYLFVPNDGSRDAWQDMSDFTQTVGDLALRAQLEEAISGRGAFSRFCRLLDRHEELLRNWRIYENERAVGRARAWLDEAGFVAVPAMPAPG